MFENYENSIYSRTENLFLRNLFLKQYIFKYIYIYAFSRRFYPKRLTIAFWLYIFNQYLCSLGIEPITFCAANAMLYRWTVIKTYTDNQYYLNFVFIMQVWSMLIQQQQEHTGKKILWRYSIHTRNLNQ